MSRLRAETARPHAELEETVAIEERLGSSEAYRELIEVFYGFVRPLEELLSRHDWAEVGVNFEARRKTGLLEQDLKAVGADPRTIEECDHLPDLSSIDRAFGAFYVLEGSTLGGQQIFRMAEKANISPESLNYFRSYGAQVGLMWKSFGDALNRFAANRDVSGIIEGAAATFESLRAWFLRRPVNS